MRIFEDTLFGSEQPFGRNKLLIFSCLERGGFGNKIASALHNLALNLILHLSGGQAHLAISLSLAEPKSWNCSKHSNFSKLARLLDKNLPFFFSAGLPQLTIAALPPPPPPAVFDRLKVSDSSWFLVRLVCLKKKIKVFSTWAGEVQRLWRNRPIRPEALQKKSHPSFYFCSVAFLLSVTYLVAAGRRLVGLVVWLFPASKVHARTRWAVAVVTIVDWASADLTNEIIFLLLFFLDVSSD